VDADKSLWDVYTALEDVERIRLIADVFETVVLGSEGIVDFSLKLLWIQAAVAPKLLLRAA